ncbi:MAG: hypothetical protein OXL96_23870, partial [Candidatus Poribacteria bacterium]|nr:hypothetical protein [Candidatus Poribacteria bacterium]
MKIAYFSLFFLLVVIFMLFLPSVFAEDSTQWKLPEGALARLGKGRISDVGYFRDGSRFVVASSIGIWIYDAQTGEALALLNEQKDRIFCIAFTPDGTVFASGDNAGRIFLWDAHTGQHKRTFTGHTNGVTSLAFSPDGKTLASVSYDTTVRLWDVETGELLKTLIGHTGYIHCVTFSPDGNTLA